MIQQMLAIWSLVPLSFLNPTWTSGSSWYMGCTKYKPGLVNFEHYFASMWDDHDCAVVWTFFGIAIPGDWNENWLFPVPWLLLSFPNLLAYWVQQFSSSMFQDLKHLYLKTSWDPTGGALGPRREKAHRIRGECAQASGCVNRSGQGKAKNAGATEPALLWSTWKLEPHSMQGLLHIEQLGAWAV